MMAWALAFFANPKRAFASAGILLATLFLGYQELRIVSRDHTIASMRVQAAEKDKTVGQLRQSLASDEAALRQYAQLAEQATAAQDAANARAKAAAVASTKALAALKAVPVPKDCAGALKWAAEAAPNIARGWDQ